MRGELRGETVAIIAAYGQPTAPLGAINGKGADDGMPSTRHSGCHRGGVSGALEGSVIK